MRGENEMNEMMCDRNCALLFLFHALAQLLFQQRDLIEELFVLLAYWPTLSYGFS